MIDRLGNTTRLTRVLIVDDDTARARWLWGLARRAHPAIVVETASEGSDAVHKLNRDHPELVLVDAGLKRHDERARAQHVHAAACTSGARCEPGRDRQRQPARARRRSMPTRRASRSYPTTASLPTRSSTACARRPNAAPRRRTQGQHDQRVAGLTLGERCSGQLVPSMRPIRQPVVRENRLLYSRAPMKRIGLAFLALAVVSTVAATPVCAPTGRRRRPHRVLRLRSAGRSPARDVPTGTCRSRRTCASTRTARPT